MTPDAGLVRRYPISMRKITAFALSALILVSTASAQVSRAPAGPVSPIKAAKPTCVCDDYKFKALTDKARAVEAYWSARRKYKSTTGVASMFALFGIIAGDQRALNEAQNATSEAATELGFARSKAESLGGIVVKNGDDNTVEIKLQKGVDYTL